MARKRQTVVNKIARKRMQARRRMRVMRYKISFLRQQNSNVGTVQIEDCDNEVFKYDNDKLNCRTYANVSRHHISQHAVDDLWTILHSFGLDRLPQNCKTLMQTPKQILIRDVAGGKQWYNGIANGLSVALKNIKSDLVLQLHFFH